MLKLRFTLCVCACVLRCSVVSDFVTPWTVAHLVPPSMEFARQEYWNALSFPSLEVLPNPGFIPKPPALAGGFFTTEIHTNILYNALRVLLNP